MIDVSTYIKMILKKKKWTNMRLCKELNKIEEQLGDSRTSPQNITNYLNGLWSFRPKILLKYEKALGLEQMTLVNMVSEVLTKESKKEFNELKKKVGEIK